MVTARQDLQRDDLINKRLRIRLRRAQAAIRLLVFDTLMHLTAAEQLGRLQIKEAHVAVREGHDHVRLELVHGNALATLLRYNKLLRVLEIVHIPQLYLTVTRG